MHSSTTSLLSEKVDEKHNDWGQWAWTIIKEEIEHLGSEIRVTFAGEVREFQEALREASGGDEVLPLEGRRHSHAQRQQQVRWLKVAAREIGQQLHVAHLRSGPITFWFTRAPMRVEIRWG